MSDTPTQKLIADLTALRDEIKLKIHLAEMDAKDAWKKLEPRLEAIEKDLTHAGKQVGAEARAALDAAKDALKSLRNRIQNPPAA